MCCLGLFLYSFLHVAKVLCSQAQTKDKDAFRDMCTFFSCAGMKTRLVGRKGVQWKKGGLCRTVRGIVRSFHIYPFCQVTWSNLESTPYTCSFNEVINTQALVVAAPQTFLSQQPEKTFEGAFDDLQSPYQNIILHPSETLRFCTLHI